MPGIHVFDVHNFHSFLVLTSLETFMFEFSFLMTKHSSENSKIFFAQKLTKVSIFSWKLLVTFFLKLSKTFSWKLQRTSNHQNSQQLCSGIKFIRKLLSSFYFFRENSSPHKMCEILFHKIVSSSARHLQCHFYVIFPFKNYENLSRFNANGITRGARINKTLLNYATTKRFLTFLICTKRDWR